MQKYVFYFKILGLLLDVVGSILVSVSLISLNQHVQEMYADNPNVSLQVHTELKHKASGELQQESSLTIIGIVLIVAGFVLLFGEEIVSHIYKE